MVAGPVWALLCAGAAPASATWSIVAVDAATREVGMALASCIGGTDIAASGFLVPDVGVVAAQANSHYAAGREAAVALRRGASPSEALAAITDPGRDPQSVLSWTSGRETRQYAIVALDPIPSSIVFTGARTFGWSGSQARDDVAAQGNLLRGESVIAASLAAYEAARSCSLADRLMMALEAGARAGGDRRCDEGLASLSAFIEVARPDDVGFERHLRLVVDHSRDTTGIGRFLLQRFRPESGDAQDDPVVRLRREFDAWRLAIEGVPACNIERGAGAAR